MNRVVKNPQTSPMVRMVGGFLLCVNTCSATKLLLHDLLLLTWTDTNDSDFVGVDGESISALANSS